MNKKVSQVASIIVFGFLITPFSIFLLSEYLEHSLMKQIARGYHVLYIKPDYLVSVAATLIGLAVTAFVLVTMIANQKQAARAEKILGVFVLIAVLIIIPGRSIERSRLMTEAEKNGYVACSIIRMPSNPGSRTIVAMARSSSYCDDSEIKTLSISGGFEELAEIDSYLIAQGKK